MENRSILIKEDLERLAEAELRYAGETGLEEYKYATDEEMLDVISRVPSK